MTAPTLSIADPSLINRQAWQIRWECRARSTSLAEAVLGMGEPTGEAEDPWGEACRTLAWQARWRGDFDAAEFYCTASLASAERSTRCAPALRGEAQATLAIVHYSRGRRDLARQAVRDGLSAIRSADLPETRAELLVLGAVVLRYGRGDVATLRALDRAMTLARGAMRPRVHHVLARILRTDGLPCDAMSHAMQALTGARRHRNRVLLPYALEVVASCHRTLGAPERARRYLSEGLELAREDGDRRAECHLLRELSLVDRDMGRTRAAHSAARDGLRLARDMKYELWERHLILQLAELAETTGDAGAALSAYKRLHHLSEAEHH